MSGTDFTRRISILMEDVVSGNHQSGFQLKHSETSRDMDQLLMLPSAIDPFRGSPTSDILQFGRFLAFRKVSQMYHPNTGPR